MEVEVGGMAENISEINNTVVRKWVYLGGMSGCFGELV